MSHFNLLQQESFVELNISIFKQSIGNDNRNIRFLVEKTWTLSQLKTLIKSRLVVVTYSKHLSVECHRRTAPNFPVKRYSGSNCNYHINCFVCKLYSPITS